MENSSAPRSNMDFSQFEARLQTFNEIFWPTENGFGVPSSERLAMAGFIFKSDKRAVHCYLCGVALTKWSFTENIFKKHQQMSPFCSFAVQNSNTTPSGHRKMAFPRSQRPLSIPNPDRQLLSTQQRIIPTNPNQLAEYMHIIPNPELLIKESERLKTYGSDWSHINFIKAEDLARAGFVSLGVRDKVQCVFCHGIFVGWEIGDIPLDLHCRICPTCPFARGANTRNISVEDEIRSMYTKEHRNFATIYRPRFDVCGSNPVNRNFFDLQPVRYGSNQMNRNSLGLQRFEAESVSSVNPNSWDAENWPSVNPNACASEQYSSRMARTRSFDSWPKRTPEYVTSLVDSGFYYTGIKDYVQCFKCGVIEKWQTTDAREVGFAKWHPNCPYILSGEEAVVTFPGNTVDCLSVARECARNLNAQVIRVFPAAESLPTSILEVEDGPRSLQEMPPSASASGTDTDVKVASTSKDSGEPKATAGMTEREFRLCKVCMAQEICMAFLPCGHLVSCLSCTNSMRKCPMCRGPIQNTVRIYWA